MSSVGKAGLKRQMTSCISELGGPRRRVLWALHGTNPICGHSTVHARSVDHLSLRQKPENPLQRDPPSADPSGGSVSQ
jgi:hypothetical protein